MSQMIYRLQTKDKWFEGKQIIKTPFKRIPCDALVVGEDEVAGFCSGDWYEDPNELMRRLEEAQVEAVNQAEQAAKEKADEEAKQVEEKAKVLAQEMFDAEKAKSKPAPRAKAKSKEDPAVNV